MNPFQQIARSYMTIGLLALVLCLSIPGMGLAVEGKIDLNAATAKQLEQLPGIGKEIAQRFGHLFLVNPNRTGVHPGVDVLHPIGRFGLCNLVFVMRERQIRSATMNIKGITQAAFRHRRTFDMPARTASTPG